MVVCIKTMLKIPMALRLLLKKEHDRGRLYEITFTADKAGVYKLRCEEHKENMAAMITVIPR